MFDTNALAVFYNERHRVWLRRKTAAQCHTIFKPAVFILHNGSIANAERSDPTFTRGINYASLWGYTDVIFVNLVTAVATDAKILVASDLNCPWSDWAIEQAVGLAEIYDGIVIAAWGAPKGSAVVRRHIAARADDIMSRNYSLHALRVTKSGWPEHILYLPADLCPKPFP